MITTAGSSGNSPIPVFRSQEATRLDGLIFGAFKSTSPFDLDRKLAKIKEHLEETRFRNPAALLEVNDRGNSLLLNIFRAARDPKVTMRQDQARKLSASLFQMVTGTCKEAVRKGRINENDYAELLAVADKNHFSLLSEAVATGDPALVEIVFGEVKTHVPKEKRQALLTLVTQPDNWNIFHEATKESRQNPDLVKILIDAFYDAFGAVARPTIERLYAQRSDIIDMPAFHDEQPVWLKNILSLSGRPEDRNPNEPDPDSESHVLGNAVRPIPRHRHR